VAARRPQRYAILRRLIEERADLDVHDHRDRTLLVNAIVHDDHKLFRLLIDGGANPHMPTEFGARMLPIHAVFMTKRQHPNLDILQSLLDLGCSPQVYPRSKTLRPPALAAHCACPFLRLPELTHIRSKGDRRPGQPCAQIRRNVRRPHLSGSRHASTQLAFARP